MSEHQKIRNNSQSSKAEKSHKLERPAKASVNMEQLLDAPQTLRPEDVLSAQQQVGNEVVQRSLDSNTIQRDGDEELKSLGGGSMNQVYRVTRPNGGPTGYFKPNSPSDPKMGAKSVLSSDINETLGLDSLAKETYKKYSGKQLGTKKGMEGTESSEVPGTPLFEQDFNTVLDKDSYEAYFGMMPNIVKQKEENGETKYYKHSSTRYMRHDFTNPQIQKDLSNLQLQDSITGQHDRHGGNIRIDDNTGRAKGYDSDMMVSSNIGENSLVNLPNLRKPKGGKPMTDEQKQIQKQSRIEALKRINAPMDKNVGLPTHVDQTTAQTLAGMNSTQFMKALEQKNKKNMKRLDKEHLEEVRNRYKMVRRYVKAGLGANSPDLIQDETKRAKWSSPEYQQTVMEGAGNVPNIVGEWGAKSYNEQVNMPSEGRKIHHTYLQRGVMSYNEAQTGNEPSLIAEETDKGPLPTNTPEAPWQKAKRNKRFGMRLNLGRVNPGITLGQHSPRTVNDTTPQNTLDDENSLDQKDTLPKTTVTPPPGSGPRQNLPRPLPTPPGKRTIPESYRNRPLPTPPVKLNVPEDEVKMQSEGKRRQNVTNANGELNSEINDAIQRKRGSGSALPEPIRAEAQKVLGRDFKDVRIHTDAESHRLSRTINARAFTIGKDIFFKQGVFAPGTTSGRETLIHELTHVVQQSGSKGGGKLKLGAPDTAHEKEADQMGKRHASGVSAFMAHAGAVQKQSEEDELQTQAEEEEIQMQGEEEELQAQSDVGGVVQRLGFDPEELKKKSQEMQQKVAKKKALKDVKSKAGSMKLGSEDHMKRLEALEKKPEMEKAKKRSYMAGLSTDEGKKNREAREAENERVKAKKEEKESRTFRGGAKKAWKEQVSSPLKEMKKGLPGKISGGLVKGGVNFAKGIGKGLFNNATSGLTSGFKHYSDTFGFDFGSDEKSKKDEDGEEKEKSDKKSSEGGGMGAIMEEYAKVLQENKELKAKLDSQEA